MENVVGRLLKGLGISVLFMIIGYAGIMFMVHRFSSSGKERDKLREQRTEIMAEQKSRDPEGKIVITNDLLDVEYKLYYSEETDRHTFISLMLYGATAVIVFVCALSLIFTIVKGKASVPRIIAAALPMILTVVVMVFIDSRSYRKLPPKPEKVTCHVETVTITKKNSKTTTDRDENGNATGTTTRYLIYFADREGEERPFSVSKSVYDKIKVKDACYMACAEAKGKEIYYCYYDEGSFVPETK